MTVRAAASAALPFADIDEVGGALARQDGGRLSSSPARGARGAVRRRRARVGRAASPTAATAARAADLTRSTATSSASSSSASSATSTSATARASTCSSRGGEREYLVCERCGRVTRVDPAQLDPVRDADPRSASDTSARFTPLPDQRALRGLRAPTRPRDRGPDASARARPRAWLAATRNAARGPANRPASGRAGAAPGRASSSGSARGRAGASRPRRRRARAIVARLERSTASGRRATGVMHDARRTSGPRRARGLERQQRVVDRAEARARGDHQRQAELAREVAHEVVAARAARAGRRRPRRRATSPPRPRRARGGDAAPPGRVGAPASSRREVGRDRRAEARGRDVLGLGPRRRAREQLVVGRPARVGRLVEARQDRLEGRDALAAARSAARARAATTVLPTPVSVPVTNSPRMPTAGLHAAALRPARRRPSQRVARPPRRRRRGAASAARALAGPEPACAPRGPSVRAASRSSAVRVRGHRRQPQPRGAGGHGRRADRLREDAALERRAGRAASRRRASPTTSGTICVSRVGRRRSPRARARCAARARSACSRSTRRGSLAQQLERGQRPATAGGGGAVEKISERARVDEVARHRRARSTTYAP